MSDAPTVRARHLQDWLALVAREPAPYSQRFLERLPAEMVAEIEAVNAGTWLPAGHHVAMADALREAFGRAREHDYYRRAHLEERPEHRQPQRLAKRPRACAVHSVAVTGADAASDSRQSAASSSRRNVATSSPAGITRASGAPCPAHWAPYPYSPVAFAAAWRAFPAS